MNPPAGAGGAAEVAALVRRVNAVYETGRAPARRANLARRPLTAQQRHSLTLAALEEGQADRSYAALLVACRLDTASELRALLRVVASNAVATVLHWALGTSLDGRPRWSADDVLAVASGRAPARGAVPSGLLHGLAELDPTVFELAAVVAPAGDATGSLPTPDEVGRLLAAVEAIYARPPAGPAAGRWAADELHALVLAELDDVERASSEVSYLELLVTWGLDTSAGLQDLLRVQAAGAARTTLRWLASLADRSTPDEWPVLADALATPWWAGEPA